MFYRRPSSARGQRGFISLGTLALGALLAFGWYHFIYKGGPSAAGGETRAAANGAVAKAGNAANQAGGKVAGAGASVGTAVAGAGNAVASIPAKIGNTVKNIVGGNRGPSGAPNLVVTSGPRNVNWMAMSKALPPLEGNPNETRQSYPASNTAQCQTGDEEGNVSATPCKCYMVVDAEGNDPDAPPVYHCAALSMASVHN